MKFKFADAQKFIRHTSTIVTKFEAGFGFPEEILLVIAKQYCGISLDGSIPTNIRARDRPVTPREYTAIAGVTRLPDTDNLSILSPTEGFMSVKQQYSDNKQNLTRIWTERLYKEYENVLYHFSVKLVAPQIVISDNTAVYGLWSPETRTISISRKLIESHAWDIVIEVLKHEMAHQIVSEVFNFYEQHGTLFRRACTMLAVTDWAASATGKLPESVPSWREKKLSEEDERLLKRAEKLLALAASVNEHEAALAMRRVRELYEKYNIEHIRNAQQTEMVWTILTRKKKKTDIIDSMILSIINKHFFVKVIHTTLFDAESCGEFKAAEVLGSRQNVLMAEYVFHFLRQQTDSLTRQYRRETGTDAIKARSYGIGLLTGFMQKLDHEAKTGISEETSALIRTGDGQAAAFLRTRHPKIANRRYGASYRDGNSYENGRKDGGKISISKGVTQSAGNKGHFLT